MEMQKTIGVFDIKEFIDMFLSEFPETSALYLFGSRAYETNSIRSDFDILAVSNEELCVAEINDFIPIVFPMVDLFIADPTLTCANSAANGSRIQLRKEKYCSLIEQLDAIQLWHIDTGFNSEYTKWKHKLLKNVEFKMSIIPSHNEGIETRIEQNLKELEDNGIKTFFAGSTPEEIGQTVLKIVHRALIPPPEWQKKAKGFRFDEIKLKNEYDFQNFIHLILHPIFPDMEQEPFMIKIDGNDKKADFSLCKNKIVIETKWIDSTSKKAEVIKTLEGLKDFYCQNPNIQCLLFLILYKQEVEIDEDKFKQLFAEEHGQNKILIEFYKNLYYI